MSKRRVYPNPAAKKVILQSKIMRDSLTRYMDMMDFTKPPEASLGNPHKEMPTNFHDVTVSTESIQSTETDQENSHTKKADVARSLFSISCSKVVVGKLGTIPLNVHFNQDEFCFRCPDYFFGKLYDLSVKLSDVMGVHIHLGSDVKVLFVTTSFVFQKLLDRYLSYPHGQDGSVCPNSCVWCQKKPEDLKYTSDFHGIVFYISNNIQQDKVVKLTNYFPQSKRTHLTIGQACERQKKHAVDIQATNEKMKHLRGPSAPTPMKIINNVHTLKHSDYWEDPSYIRVPMAPKVVRIQQTQKKKQEPATNENIRSEEKRAFPSRPKYLSIPALTVTNAMESECARAESDDSDTLELLEFKDQPQVRSEKMDHGVRLLRSVVRKTGKQEMVNLEEDNDQREEYYVVFPPPPEGGGIAILKRELTCLKPRNWLNDTIIDFWFKFIFLNKCTAEEQKRVLFFSSYFCTLLAQEKEDTSSKSLAERKYERAKRWTKNENVFEKDFLVFPVNRSDHWFLAVVCFPGKVHQDSQAAPIKDPSLPCNNSEEVLQKSNEMQPAELESGSPKKDLSDGTTSLDTENGTAFSSPDVVERPNLLINNEGVLIKRPCIIIFDSLQGIREDSADDIRMFLEMECKIRMDCQAMFDKETMPTIHPKVPLQDNHFDCGIFLIQFVETFCETLLKNFEVPIISFEDWFSQQVVQGKRKELLSLLRLLHEEQAGQEFLRPKDKIILGRFQN